MTHYIQILKDTLGNNYLGIKMDKQLLLPFLDRLKEILGESYNEFTKLQQQRDSGTYHITLMNVMEFNQKSSEMGFDKFTQHIQHLLKTAIDDIKLMGVGSAEKSGNRSYFIVVDSNLLQESRNVFGLEPKDLHITIGFKWKDVHGVRKNKILTSDNKFLNKLKSSYTKENETFEFIKGLPNFDYDIYKQVEPISIKETNAIFRCGENDYLQLTLVDDQLTITGKWQDTNRLPILSTTLIQKKFKQIN
jgi:hypothetical protein